MRERERDRGVGGGLSHRERERVGEVGRKQEKARGIDRKGGGGELSQRVGGEEELKPPHKQI